jgi:hypothetical protein
VSDYEADPPHEDPADAFSESVRYRSAYELACRLRDVGKFSTAGGSRERLYFAAGQQREAILREVIRQKGDHEDVREGVEDACEGRQPRW